MTLLIVGVPAVSVRCGDGAAAVVIMGSGAIVNIVVGIIIMVIVVACLSAPALI